MTTQSLLSSFSQKTVQPGSNSFRRWNNVILEWDVDYQGYARPEDDGASGYRNYHVVAQIVEALVWAKHPHKNKKIEVPGYKVVVTQSVVIESNKIDDYLAYEESFKKEQIKKAVDAFQNELVNIQIWIHISESRARLIPEGKDAFECPSCGWVSDEISNDITCEGCGKRFWTKAMWGNWAFDVPSSHEN